jgi:uncharacterized protein YacL
MIDYLVTGVVDSFSTWSATLAPVVPQYYPTVVKLNPPSIVSTSIGVIIGLVIFELLIKPVILVFKVKYYPYTKLLKFFERGSK